MTQKYLKRTPKTPFGHWIREQRESRNMTQAALADALHLTFNIVSKWEHSSNRIKPEYIPSVAAFFGVPELFIERLAGYTESETIDPPRVRCSSRSCRRCGEKIGAICGKLVHQNLPMLCESVTREDIRAAERRGLKGFLLESRETPIPKGLKPKGKK